MDDLANYAEVISSAAVLIGLVFAGVQLRQFRRLAQGELRVHQNSVALDLDQTGATEKPRGSAVPALQ